ncbi:MAG: 3-deoxy-D-manno-octulosonic acid kinase [Lysobacteraceae bacterium]
MHSFRDAAGTGALLFDRALLPQADGLLFDPANPVLAAQPVAVGGRGAAWFVRTNAGDAVLRHYRRGGMVARFSRETYLWQGAERTRSFREFRLLQALHDRNLSVPKPLAAVYWRNGTGYRAALLMSRIADATSIGGLLDRNETIPWPEIGSTIARFHRAGACHADLNVDNVLMDAHGKLWLIDFDRGTLRAPARGWQQANLSRLWRSVRKRLGMRAKGEQIVAGWNAMRTAYAAALQEQA